MIKFSNNMFFICLELWCKCTDELEGLKSIGNDYQYTMDPPLMSFGRKSMSQNKNIWFEKNNKCIVNQCNNQPIVEWNNLEDIHRHQYA